MKNRTLSKSLFSLLLVFSACAKPTSPEVITGTTTKSELIATLGSPAHTDAVPIRPQAQMLSYKNGCGYQIENEVVVGASCPPKPHETALPYWRQRWQAHPLVYKEIVAAKSIHGARTFELISAVNQMKVIYDESTDRVIRVVSYGSK